MSGIRKLEHAELRVIDLDEAVDFYTDVMGLNRLQEEAGVVYLGCGLDENYDLAVREGKTGVEHFAIRVQNEEELDSYEHRLHENNVQVERSKGIEPGQDDGIRFELPNGCQMEFVVVQDSSYHHPAYADHTRAGTAPLDLDHINLMGMDAERTAKFLRDVLGFRVSDVIESETGYWIQSWLRLGDLHHDVAVNTADNVKTTLDHLAWHMSDFSHMKSFIDKFVQEGYQLELGPSRHNAGSNLFAYFWEPGGNRFEVTAEMATVDPEAETQYRQVEWRSGPLEEMHAENTVSSWNGVEPTKTFMEKGS